VDFRSQFTAGEGRGRESREKVEKWREGGKEEPKEGGELGMDGWEKEYNCKVSSKNSKRLLKNL